MPVRGAAAGRADRGAHSSIPTTPLLARNDLLTIVAVLLQIVMLAARLETIGELRVILLFHVVGTVMELFKTDVGSWVYASEGVLRVGAVPLFTGFMYAAVGSYMVRVFRLFDLRFDRYPPSLDHRRSSRRRSTSTSSATTTSSTCARCSSRRSW